MFKAKCIGEPIPEYKDDSYKDFSKPSKKLYLKKYHIPTNHEVELLSEENRKLKDEIKKLRDILKAKANHKNS